MQMHCKQACLSQEEEANVSSEQIWTFDQPEWGVSSDWHMYSDCHHSDVGYTYFTIAYENGTLATDLSNKPALFYIKTSWNIDYQDRLRAAILSDPASLSNNEKVKYDDCFQGHCYSEVIPGVRHRDKPVILKHVENPTIIRHIGRWTNAVCGYSDSVRKVSKNIVSLAQIGYYPFGARIPPAILDFVEAKIKTTYPIVEITLICLFTVGLLPCLIAFSALIWMLVRLARRMDATFTKICGPPKRWHNTVWRGISKAAGWMCNAMFRHGDQTDQMQGSGQGNGQPNIELSDYASTRPPNYKTYASRPGLDLV